MVCKHLRQCTAAPGGGGGVKKSFSFFFSAPEFIDFLENKLNCITGMVRGDRRHKPPLGGGTRGVIVMGGTACEGKAHEWAEESWSNALRQWRICFVSLSHPIYLTPIQP